MSIVLVVSTPFCDHRHEVRAEETDDGVRVLVDSDCGHLGSEVVFTKMELMQPEVFYKKINDFMKPNCVPQCFIPILISNISRAELGLSSERKLMENDELLETEFK
ncbi:hypothetical protein [Methanonatronarchaeum sp. AMET-Sl]|uniref:hypothetical protein n=1 Tax=Methanonatronarchaeum sp. AMET-Sl TaxID=3037654 RepID=UPI00244E2A9D|nr:hypothetical protein [Methanonatronarchaeum sp. AMET-Sl]WGI16874.1 hypothetical protein QEN48_05090 [Methanonatronarchaeum sp. AMET-Sl]